MAVPFYLQYYVEFDRNTKYQWINFGLQISSLILHGIFFHWIPKYFRNKRTRKGLRFAPYFKFLKYWDTFNKVYSIRIPYITKIYFQPSLLIVLGGFVAINGVFSFIATSDLDYQPREYIIAKRLSRMAVSNLPLLYLLVIKNDLLTSISGLQHDRLVLFHKWISRVMFVMVVVHIGLSMKYWLNLGFDVMLVIPPQIFGYIAFASFFFLNFGSLKFIRRWAYDFFLIEHRVFSFIMLLLTFFHNMKGTKGAVILAVHQLVLDRILSRVLSFIHARTSPTRGKSSFEILDDETVLVTVPIKAYEFHERKWYNVFLPKLNTWKAGQHVYLTVGKVKFFQQHPFTIASLSDTKEMKFVIRVQKGFTKLLKKKILKLEQERDEKKEVEESTASLSDSSSVSSSSVPSSVQSSNTSNSIDVDTELMPGSKTPEKYFNDDEIIMKATFVGPVGARYQPLITFDTSVFFSTGSGASFTFPVCLDVLKTITKRNQIDDFIGRPMKSTIRIVWVIRQVENVHWYDFILDELLAYCKSGDLQFDIYVTQDEEANESIFKERISILNSSGSSNYNIEKSESEKVETNSITEKSTSILDCENVYFHRGRPNIAEIVSSETDKLTGNDPKSLALVSCGTEAFTHDIKTNAVKYKWVTEAPDIYCYTESFG
ncbi:hypothetical protein CLIB1444_09S03048 [[Candida] jaroonii]|uniref:Uncharacterized protein n=1 Tax=[Candida] jaroonii TaxID=467808 RepID=A0ACA9YCJ2_9ASCO|nr:hypothetical protein CLIB1444_09S03048 [[Candida] jaroonii]